MHFLGEQFPHQKMLPQRDFAAFLADFLWLVSGRQQHPGPLLKLECLGIARP